MTKYIKNKDGKFAGSIGDGKSAVPTTAPAAAPISSSETSAAHKDTELTVMAENYRNQIKEATEATFGGHASLGETTLSNDPEMWASNLYNLIEVRTPEEFNEQFIQKTEHSNNGFDEKHWMIHDGDTATAVLIYSRDNDYAWIETYTQSAGVAQTVTLQDSYTAYLRD